MVALGFVHARELAGRYAIEVSGEMVPAEASLQAPLRFR
jgi:hypothetical protein